MSKGWIKVYRSIMDNDIWKDKPFSRGQAWIDLLMLAAHKDTEFYFDSSLFPLKKGEIITSKRKLETRWGWSNSKINKFLDELEKVEMLSKKSDTKKTTIKITKYSEYQSFEAIEASDKTSQKTTQKHHRGITEASQKHTYNNIKNYKNEKNEKNNIEPSAQFSNHLNFPSQEDIDYEEMCKRLDERKRGKHNEQYL